MFGRGLALIFMTATVLSPALAQTGGSSIPEPSGIALFGMGIAGVIIGRHFSRKRPD